MSYIRPPLNLLADVAEEEAREADEPIRFTEHEAQTVLAALRQMEEPRPGVYSAALKVEAWLLAR